MSEPSTHLPIHNVEVEQALLGAALVNPQSVNMVSGLVSPEDFFEIMHAEIWRRCVDAVAAGKHIDIKLLIAAIGKDAKSPVYDDPNDQTTVAQYIAALASNATSVINAPDYACMIRDLADQRRIADCGASLRRETPTDPSKLASDGIDMLDSIVARRSMTGAPSVSLREGVARGIEAIALAYQNDGKLTGLTWGLKGLNDKTLGCQRGDLIIMAGRPGMGKSAVAITVARCMAEEGFKGDFYSLEMGDVSLSQRFISDMMFDKLRIPYWRLRSGKISEGEYYQVRDAAEALAKLPIRIEQQPKMTVGQIAARARQHKRRSGLDFMVIDHLQIMGVSDSYRGNRNNEIGEITSSLKGLAKELDIPIILLSQLSRKVEERDDKRPNLSDLRDSGNIEQDADVVVMLYREQYYLERREPPPNTEEFTKWASQAVSARDKLEAIIEKQRNGPVGRVNLFCSISCNAIRNADYGRV